MNPNTMTLDEVRDALAEMDGWVLQINPGNWWNERLGKFAPGNHPHPATLDGAAAALPKGWVWCMCLDDRENPDGWYAWKPTYRYSSQYVPHGSDEITARYRLALACRLAEKVATK